jgi:anaerobic dimethyl sulfoxide reductase subunit B (iron-sulfur subunit)
MSQLGFLIDATRCINCRTCEIACKDANGAALGQRLRRVRTFEGGEYPHPLVANLSLACCHCERPQCLEACPAKAYRKRADGIVVHDPEACIGCQYCTWACPYGAPQYDPGAGRVMKCNLCAERLDAGEPPACVAACPMRAIEVGPLAELEARPGVVAAVLNLPDPALTGPALRFRIREEMKA